MNADQLIARGTYLREINDASGALSCYGQALIADPESAAAFNNYGNTLRELGYPRRAIPFLEHALILDPNMGAAAFNLSVCYLLMGDYRRGWPAYESRWNFEHLQGTLPQLSKPRWCGGDIDGQTLAIFGEQGYGDMIQFSRYISQAEEVGARVSAVVHPSLLTLMKQSFPRVRFETSLNSNEFDQWQMMLSLPQYFDQNIELSSGGRFSYLSAESTQISEWKTLLGAHDSLRVGICWSGNRRSWINRHKSMLLDQLLSLTLGYPNIQWINLQVDLQPDELDKLIQANIKTFPGSIKDWNDTAALISNLDLVITVDTALAHLAGGLGRPTWLMLNHYAVDWRWGLEGQTCAWYPTMKIFRQPSMGDWSSVIQQLNNYLKWYKI